MTAPGAPTKRFGRPLLAVTVIALAVLGVLRFPLAAWALELVEWIRSAGGVGVFVFALAYVAAAVLALPGSLLTMGAGFVYGPAWGILIVSPISTLAATASFLMARFVARDWVLSKVTGHPKFAAIDAAVGDSSFKIVALLRLSPVLPFNLLNYALGLTRVRLRDYALASWLGMLPGTLLYVYIGSLVTSASELASGNRPDVGPFGAALYWGGLGATVLVTVSITRTAKRALSGALKRSERGSSPEQPT